MTLFIKVWEVPNIIILVPIMTLFIMVWEVINTLFINICNVGDREPVQSCPALDVMVC